MGLIFPFPLHHYYSTVSQLVQLYTKVRKKAILLFLTDRGDVLLFLLHFDFISKCGLCSLLMHVWEKRDHIQVTLKALFDSSPLPFFFFLSSFSFFSFQWHFLWWALWKNSYCLSCQFCFVSSECWVLLCHFQGLFQSLEHSWRFNQKLTPWRSWQLIPNQLCGRYIIYFTVHSGIPFSFHHWERLYHSGVLYKNINNVPFS